MSAAKLWKAVRKEDNTSVRDILNSYSTTERRSILSQPNKRGECLIHTAIQVSSTDVIETLLSYDEVDIDLYDGEYGYTTLIAAIAFGSETAVVHKILSKNPDCSLRDKTEVANSAFHWASALNNISGLEELLKAKKEYRDILNANKETPLHAAINEGQEEAAILLIDRDVDINMKDDKGFTPVYLAVMYRLPNIASILLMNSKLSISDCYDKNGNSPLHAACQTQQTNLIPLLKSKGFTMEDKNYQGQCAGDILLPHIEEPGRTQTDAKKEKSAKKQADRQADMESTEVYQFLQQYGTDSAQRSSVQQFLYKKKYHTIDNDFWSLNDTKLKRLGLKILDERLLIDNAMKAYKAEVFRKELEEQQMLRDREASEQTRRLLTAIGIFVGIFVVLFGLFKFHIIHLFFKK